jgi:hypothetical protein
VQKGSIGVIMLPFNRIIAINSPIIVIIEKHRSAIWLGFYCSKEAESRIRQKSGTRHLHLARPVLPVLALSLL